MIIFRLFSLFANYMTSHKIALDISGLLIMVVAIGSAVYIHRDHRGYQKTKRALVCVELGCAISVMLTFSRNLYLYGLSALCIIVVAIIGIYAVVSYKRNIRYINKTIETDPFVQKKMAQLAVEHPGRSYNINQMNKIIDEVKRDEKQK